MFSFLLKQSKKEETSDSLLAEDIRAATEALNYALDAAHRAGLSVSMSAHSRLSSYTDHISNSRIKIGDITRHKTESF